MGLRSIGSGEGHIATLYITLILFLTTVVGSRVCRHFWASSSLTDGCDRKNKKGVKTYQASPYIGFMPLAVQRQRSLCGLKSMASRMLTTAACRKRGGHGWWCMRYGCRGSLSSRTCIGMAALASGQLKVGVHKDGVRMRVERVRKCTGLEKKKKAKRGLMKSNPHKNNDLHRSCMSCVCVTLVGACREARRGGVQEGGINSK